MLLYKGKPFERPYSDAYLTSHASQCELVSKHKPGQTYNPSAFIDRKGYDTAIRNLQNEFRKKEKAR